jgi:hypothetical protein
MAETPKVQFYRKDEEDIEVQLKFNEPALKLIQSKPFDLEDCKKGILITFPTIDSYNSFKVTSKKREVDFDSEHDVESEWYPMTEEVNGYYLIDLYFED